jgi:hypothetical protein
LEAKEMAIKATTAASVAKKLGKAVAKDARAVKVSSAKAAVKRAVTNPKATTKSAAKRVAGTKAGQKVGGFVKKHPIGVGTAGMAAASAAGSYGVGAVAGKRRARATGEESKGLKQQWKEGNTKKKVAMVGKSIIAHPSPVLGPLYYGAYTAGKVKASKKELAKKAKKA